MSRAYTQRDKILDYIKKFGSITSYEAYKDLGITQLGARVFELKERGYNIVAEYETGKNRYGESVRFSRYRLEVVEDEKID